MAEVHFHGNNAYIEIDGVDMSPDWIDGSLTGTNEGQELTAGAGRTGMQRGDGLDDVAGSFTFQYNSVSFGSQILRLRAGKHDMVMCPEGNVSGKPKHAGSLRISSTELAGQSVSKTAVNIAVSVEQADDPTTNIFAGGTV